MEDCHRILTNISLHVELTTKKPLKMAPPARQHTLSAGRTERSSPRVPILFLATLWLLLDDVTGRCNVELYIYNTTSTTYASIKLMGNITNTTNNFSLPLKGVTIATLCVSSSVCSLTSAHTFDTHWSLYVAENLTRTLQQMPRHTLFVALTANSTALHNKTLDEFKKMGFTTPAMVNSRKVALFGIKDGNCKPIQSSNPDGAESLRLTFDLLGEYTLHVSAIGYRQYHVTTLKENS